MLEKLNVYNELSGITTNQSEGYNTLLKQYGHWKEAPLDALILGLYQLQIFYHNEIQRGYSGMGSYSLLDDFSHAAIAVDEVISIAVTQPADIVSKIRSNEGLKLTFTAVDDRMEDEDVKPTAAMDDRMENQDVKPTAAMDDCMEDQDVKPTAAVNDHMENQDVQPTAAMDDRMEDQDVKPTAAMNDHMENQDVQPTAAMDDRMEDQDVKPTATMNDHIEDQAIKPTVTAAVDDLIEDNETKPTVTAVTGLDDRGVTTTNETTQLSRARYASSCAYL